MTSTKTKTTGARSRLSSLGGNKTKASTSTTPMVNVTSEADLKLMLAIVKAKRDKKSAESALSLAEGQFREKATKRFEVRCREDSQLHTSIRLVGNLESEAGTTETLSLLFTQARSVCQMTENDATDPLVAVFGDDFEKYFTPQRDVVIDTSVLSEKQIDDVVTALETTLGDKCSSAVSSKCMIEAKEAFCRARILDDRVRKQAERASSDGFAVMKKASFKL